MRTVDDRDTERREMMRPELKVMLMKLEETDLRCMEAHCYRVKMRARARRFQNSESLPFVIHNILS